ncbi:hypothetical protein HAX54_040460 [Datura stramonium]|uniref:Uncharacterized protein n=1 Tax=Datura stramonium TaxID=4076 RepID=A0ABS8SK13_DATST|nr:hypothetical protein [Datura stramonium]
MMAGVGQSLSVTGCASYSSNYPPLISPTSPKNPTVTENHPNANQSMKKFVDLVEPNAMNIPRHIGVEPIPIKQDKDDEIDPTLDKQQKAADEIRTINRKKIWQPTKDKREESNEIEKAQQVIQNKDQTKSMDSSKREDMDSKQVEGGRTLKWGDIMEELEEEVEEGEFRKEEMKRGNEEGCSTVAICPIILEPIEVLDAAEEKDNEVHSAEEKDNEVHSTEEKDNEDLQWKEERKHKTEGEKLNGELFLSQGMQQEDQTSKENRRKEIPVKTIHDIVSHNVAVLQGIGEDSREATDITNKQGDEAEVNCDQG